MSSQWRRQQNGNNSNYFGLIAFWVVIIGIIVYLFLPDFLSGINSVVNPDPKATSLYDNTLTGTNELSNTNDLNSTDYSAQLYPYLSNTYNSTLYNGISDNSIATGYWILFVSNGELQQLPINSQSFTYIQKLITDDGKRISNNTIFLANNGQVQQYIVSNEIYSIITNLQIIVSRSNNNTTPNSVPSTIQPTTPVNEVMTVISSSTTGFTIELNPALNGLTISNFTLIDNQGYTLSLNSASTSDGGTTYTISANLSTGQTYTLTAECTGYTFEPVQVLVSI